MTSRPKYNQYLTSNRRQVPAGQCITYLFTKSSGTAGGAPSIFDEKGILILMVSSALWLNNSGSLDSLWNSKSNNILVNG